MTEGLHFHFSLSCIGEGNGNPLQCSCLENPRDGGAWWAAIYGVAQSRARLKRLSSSSSSFLYSRVPRPLACTKIPWTEEPGGLQSMGSLWVRHDWATSLSLSTFLHWRRKWHPLQCSCLENPRDGGACWAACWVAQSRTWLKRLSSSSSIAEACIQRI